MQNDSALRAIATRLTVTPVEDLPRIVGFLASSLAQCSLEDVFSDNKTKAGASVAAHRLRTRIASLLQDRSTAGRLTAAVLIKAIIDGGGSNVLAAADVWARGLLTCLNKPDSAHVKKVYLSTVTRIFLLTQNHPTLLREVTTPLLPAYMTACLGLIRPVKDQIGGQPTEVASPLLDPVLQCWIELLPQHATVFRPFLTRMRLFGQGLLEDGGTSTSTRELASQLMCLCISCAPKNIAPQEWTQTATGIVGSAHQTADQLFRAVIEEYEPNDTSNRRSIGKLNFSKEPKTSAKDHLGLDAWTGIQQGSTRLVVLIDWLGSLISTPTPHLVKVPLGPLLDLTSRLLAVTSPGSKADAATALRYHNEASRDEKEQLWLNLPQIHTSCLLLLHKLNTIYEQSLVAAKSATINQILDNFEVMSGHKTVRQTVYTIFAGVMSSIDFTQLKLSRTAFSVLVEQCCNELKTCLLLTTDLVKPNNSKDGFISIKPVPAASNNLQRKRSKVFQAAWALLPQIIAHCPNSMISRQLRIEMDRLAVLLDHKDAMLASVMRPMLSDKGKATTASLLPFLARSSADSITTETLIRPRMPVAQIGAHLTQSSPQEGLLAGDEQQEELDSVDDDMLSRLEDSLDALNETVEGEKQAPINANSPLHRDSFQEKPASAHKKRTRDNVERTDQEGSAVNSQLSALRESKMPRLGEKAMEDFDLQIDHTAVIYAEQPPDSALFGLVDSASQSKEVSSLETAVKIPTANDESDSDDSEIPQIDPGFTDEEESE